MQLLLPSPRNGRSFSVAFPRGALLLALAVGCADPEADDGSDSRHTESADTDDSDSRAMSTDDAAGGESGEATMQPVGVGGTTGADASGGSMDAEEAPLYEQLECDLPAVLEYCGGGACHYDTAAPEVGSSLALWDRGAQKIVDGLESRLVNAPADYRNVVSADSCPSEPELLVDAADIEQSLLLKKLLGTHECGDEMPKFPYPEWGTVSIPGEQREAFVECFREWLTLLIEDFNEGG